MVAKFVQPNYTTQSAAVYKAAIDAAIAVLARQSGAFAAYQQDVGSPAPELSVRIAAGMIWDGRSLAEVAAQTVSGFTVPSAGQHRVDRVVIDQSTGVATRVAGTAVTGSPSATPPAIPAGKLPCCQVLITSADSVITNAMITDERALRTTGPTLVAEQAASGTSIDFTSIPSWVKKITLMFNALSTNGTDNYLIQLGDAGGIEATGYSAGATTSTSETNYTTGFGIPSGAAANVHNGSITFTLQDSSDNTWCAQGYLWNGSVGMAFGGSKALSAALDRIRLTTTGGANTFDNGSVSLLLE